MIKQKNSGSIRNKTDLQNAFITKTLDIIITGWEKQDYLIYHEKLHLCLIALKWGLITENIRSLLYNLFGLS